MRNLKNKLKKTFLVLGFLGLIGVGVEAFILRDFNKKNVYLENKYNGMREKYLDLATKYNILEMKSFKDSANLSMKYSLDFISLQKEYIDLIYNYNLLEKECLGFAENCLEKEQEKKEVFDKLIFVTSERDFYKEATAYLDSLLSKYIFEIPTVEGDFFK